MERVLENFEAPLLYCDGFLHKFSIVESHKSISNSPLCWIEIDPLVIIPIPLRALPPFLFEVPLIPLIRLLFKLI